jgi:hypothetical protein
MGSGKEERGAWWKGITNSRGECFGEEGEKGQEQGQRSMRVGEIGGSTVGKAESDADAAVGDYAGPPRSAYGAVIEYSKRSSSDAPQ